MEGLCRAAPAKPASLMIHLSCKRNYVVMKLIFKTDTFLQYKQQKFLILTLSKVVEYFTTILREGGRLERSITKIITAFRSNHSNCYTI